jgi:hypothetical protein
MGRLESVVLLSSFLSCLISKESLPSSYSFVSTKEKQRARRGCTRWTWWNISCATRLWFLEALANLPGRGPFKAGTAFCLHTPANKYATTQRIYGFGSWERRFTSTITTFPEPILKSPHDFSLSNAKKSRMKDLSSRSGGTQPHRSVHEGTQRAQRIGATARATGGYNIRIGYRTVLDVIRMEAP